MARLTGPLFSLSASGSVANTIVYSNWKGIDYLRERVVPYNPKTAAQGGIRSTTQWGVLYFTKGSYIAAAQKTWWNTYAEGTGMSGWNRFLRFFVQTNYDSVTQAFVYAHIPQPQ